MRVLEQDLRRYAWCWGQAIYKLGISVPSLLEDMDGALEADQPEVAARAARILADECATIWLLVTTHVRPMPRDSHQPLAGIDRLPEDVRAEVLDLCRGAQPADGAAVRRHVERARALADRSRAIVEETPNILTPDGYYPALRLGGEWIRLLDSVNEADFLPESWKQDAMEE